MQDDESPSLLMAGAFVFVFLYVDAGMTAFGMPSLSIPAALADEKEEHGHDKVVICHRPPGDPTNEQTLQVDQSAVAAHMAHGDSMGACAADSANLICSCGVNLSNSAGDDNDNSAGDDNIAGDDNVAGDGVENTAGDDNLAGNDNAEGDDVDNIDNSVATAAACTCADGSTGYWSASTGGPPVVPGTTSVPQSVREIHGK